MRPDRHPSPPLRESDRKEWSRSLDHEHQFEAREHARLPGRMRRKRSSRDAAAEHQIRELRGRY